MAIDRLVAPLLRVPLFAGLKPLQLTELARQAERVKFRRGDVITKAGEPGDGAYLDRVGAGRARRHRRTSKPPPSPSSPARSSARWPCWSSTTIGATVVARDRVLCLKITRAAVRAQMLEDAALARHFERRISERLSRVADDLRRIDGILAACGSERATT